MTRILQRLGLMLAVMLGLGTLAARAENVREVIYFIGEDGKSYQLYDGTRSNYRSYNIFQEKGATLDGYLYFFPNEYRWDRTADADYDIIRINQGSMSQIMAGTLDDELTETAPGTFSFFSHPRQDDPEDPKYGYWNTPDPYDKFVYAWILPANIEIVDARSNREGEWVRRGNAIAWFGTGTQNVTFEIDYRFTSAGLQDAVSAAVGDETGIALEQGSEGLRITLADTLLFASGSAELSPAGKAVVARLAGAIDFGGGATLIVEGHTDNVPIRGVLTETFATNWELSAARALAVVRAIEGEGAPGEALEARAYGEFRPVEDNATVEGRAANRRIVMLVKGG